MNDNNPIFDFHFHLLFKAFIKEYEIVYPSERAVGELLEPFDIEHALWDKIDELFLHFLDSQCAFNQITAGNVTRGFVAIAPIEKMFASKKGLGGKLLNDKVVTNPMDPKYLEQVREGNISYYHLFIKELQLYKALNDSSKVTFSFASRSPSAKQKVGPRFALGMEGGHSLIRSKIGKPGIEDAHHDYSSNGAFPIYKDFAEHPLLYPDESLVNLQEAMWKEGLDLRYLILTHLSDIPGQSLATHAYGAKFLKSSLKYPVGFGINKRGKEVIDAAYTLKIDNEDASVLIDIKHMSLKSRLDFYQIRRQNPEYAKLPIIASHMGVTGYTISEWKEALVRAQMGKSNVPTVKLHTEPQVAGKWGGISRTYDFNPWTINLMDDDIIEIIASEGLIGVSLDVRILGFESRFQDATRDTVSEYMSPEEFRYFFPRYPIKGLPLESMQDEELESQFFPNKKESHLLSFCFNVLHIINVAKTGVPDKNNYWKYVCIGSDFDGLIDPLKTCRDASLFPNLRKDLRKWLPIADKSYAKFNGTDRIIDQASLSECIESLLFKSGNDFLKRLH